MSSGKTIGLIKAVGGPGGGGGTSNAVQYIPQELTEEQQMQARKNLNLYRKEVAVGERVGGSNNAQWTEANGMYVDQQFELRTDAFDVLSGVLGKTFVVYWGEDKFTVKTERDSSGVVYAGNANFVSGSDDGTGLPFVIVDAIALGAGTTAAGRTGPNTVDIFAIEETITPILPEYLPSDIDIVANFDDGTFAASITFEEAWKMSPAELNRRIAFYNSEETKAELQGYSPTSVSKAAIRSIGNHIIIEVNGPYAESSTTYRYGDEPMVLCWSESGVSIMTKAV